MKKGSEWFKLLSEKEQQEFKENCIDFEDTMNYPYKSFKWFIMEAFIWSDTPQGLDYWNEISKRHK
jgi:hypothetical protein